MLYVIFAGIPDEVISAYNEYLAENTNGKTFSPIFLEDLSLKEGNNGQKKFYLCPAPEFREFSLFAVAQENYTYDLKVLEERGRHWVVCEFFPTKGGENENSSGDKSA